MSSSGYLSTAVAKAAAAALTVETVPRASQHAQKLFDQIGFYKARSISLALLASGENTLNFYTEANAAYRLLLDKRLSFTDDHGNQQNDWAQVDWYCPTLILEGSTASYLSFKCHLDDKYTCIVTLTQEACDPLDPQQAYQVEQTVWQQHAKTINPVRDRYRLYTALLVESNGQATTLPTFGD